MKTNVTLISDDRVLFGHVIKQNTKDHSLSVTDLQNAYAFARFQYGWSDRRVTDILQYKPVQDRVYHLLNERGLIKTSLPAFMEMVDKEGIVKVLKGLQVWKTTGRGANKSTFADPYIWVLLAMELNPLIYAKVIMWLTDSLIFNRVLAGDNYRPMTNAISNIIPDPDYSLICRTINERVFGYHEKDIRNKAAQDRLLELSDFQKYITQSIKIGVIRNSKDLFRVIECYQLTENQQVKKFA